MNFLRRWRKRRQIGGEIRKEKSWLAGLYRRYDAVCRKPGETSVFTADEIGALGGQIAMSTYRLKQLYRELNDEADSEPQA